MVHNYHLEEARKKDRILGVKSKMMNSTRLLGIASSSKPLARNTQQKTMDWLASKSSCAKENDMQV